MAILSCICFCDIDASLGILRVLRGDKLKHMMLLFAYFFLERGIKLREFAVTELFLRNAFSPDPTNLQLHLGHDLTIAQILDLHAGYSVIFTLAMKKTERRSHIDQIFSVSPDLSNRGSTL